MSALPINFDPYNPIPNQPFYSPVTNYLQGPTGPLVIGSGLSVSLSGVLSSTGGSGGGTVTTITAGTGLTGGSITSTGTIAIANTGVVAGAYTFPALSVNAQGQVTSIANGYPVLTVTANAPLSVAGTPQLPVLSVAQASVSVVGVTQLNNTTSSTLTNQALTAAAGKNLQDQINAIAQGSGTLILAGTFNASTGNVVTSTTAGTAAGILSAAPLPSPTTALNDYYLVVTTAATSYTPPGSPVISNINVGDYIICASGVWTILRVGPITGAYATTTTAGVVELATTAEAIAGTNPNTVLTPQTAGATYIPKNIITAQGQIIAGTGSGSYTALGVGVDGYVLTADASCAAGVKWAASTGGGGSGVTSLTGASPIYVTPSPITGVGSIGVNSASTAATGVVQLADVAATQAGVSTTLALTPAGGAASYVLSCSIGGKGDLFVGCANDTYTILTPGTDGQALVACAACTSGLTWAPPGALALPTTAGIVFGRACDGGLNTAIGYQALLSLTTGVGNAALGRGAGALLAAGSCNTAIGTAALAAEATGSNNTALGGGALCAQNGSSNNTAIGFGAANSLTTGFNNTALGSCAADSLTTGCFNVLIGQGSALGMISGSENTFIGDATGPLNVDGSFNVYLGSSAGATNTSGSRVVIIGADGTSSSPTVSNEVNIWAGTTVARFVQGAGLWSFPSDVRRKENIADLTLGLDFLSKVQPRTFDWKEDGKHSAGFIAQELDEVVQEFGAEHLGVVSKADPDCYTVGSAALIPVLVNAVKELAAEVAELKAKLG
jgi:hypothetical protein